MIIGGISQHTPSMVVLIEVLSSYCNTLLLLFFFDGRSLLGSPVGELETLVNELRSLCGLGEDVGRYHFGGGG